MRRYGCNKLQELGKATIGKRQKGDPNTEWMINEDQSKHNLDLRLARNDYISLKHWGAPRPAGIFKLLAALTRNGHAYEICIELDLGDFLGQGSNESIVERWCLGTHPSGDKFVHS